MKNKDILLSIILGLLITGWLIFFQKQLEVFVFDTTYNQLPEILVANISQNVPKQKTPTPIIIPEFQAKSVFSFKVNQKEENVIYQKNIQEKLPIASLTKLMTAVIAIENYPLDEKITISKEAVLQEGDFGKLKVGEAMSVENLLYLSLIESSNDTAYALSEKMDSTGHSDPDESSGVRPEDSAPRDSMSSPQVGVQQFVDKMNLKAKAIGMQNTNFANPTGLNGSENYSTSEDLAKLIKHIIFNYPQILDITSKVSAEILNEDGSLHHLAINTNELLGKVPDIIGGKTGYNEEANGCLILVLKKGNYYLVNIILGSPNRFSEMEALVNWVKEIKQW